MELLDSLHQSIKKSLESAVGLNRNRTRICLGVTGAETCRQEGFFFLPAGAGSAVDGFTYVTRVNTGGVGAARAGAVIAYKWSRVKPVRV